MWQCFLPLPFKIIVADIRSLEVLVSATIYIEEREHMGKIKYLISWLGTKFFSSLPERKRQRIIVQIVVGIFLALASLVGIWLCQYREEKQIEKYQTIAEAYAQPDSVSDGTKEKSQKKTVNKIKRIFLEMKEDAEKYRQEHEVEMQENSIEVYDWDALCSVNEDIKGWLYMPNTLINFPVVGMDDNAFYLSHDFSGEKSSAGCPFMDKDTQVWDFNRVIYGHNMGAGSYAMFSTLLN